MKIIASILFIFMSFVTAAQIGSGTIKIRKTDESIIGKTLSIYDLRTQECGTITFEDTENCELNFKYKKEEIQNIRVFLNSRNNSKKVSCTYTLISDTSFIIKSDDWQDTCSYIYNNAESNMVKFFYTPQGVFDNNQFAFFYGIDSVVYSQSYLRSLADLTFTDSILVIDSIYKNIRDEEKREELNKQLRLKIEAYKKNINYSFFAGKYKLDKNKIILLNKANNREFATIFIQKNGDFHSLFSHNRLSISKPLISIYTHKTFGSVIFNYDKCYIQYNKPTTGNTKQIIKGNILKTDTLNINYPLGEREIIYSGNDTFKVINAEYNDYVKFKGVIGGYYPSYKESLNGLKLQLNPLFFTSSKAFSVKNKTISDTIEEWTYKIHNNIFFLCNNKDTLVDEMKNGFNSFRFTYKNNSPYVFGAYHRKVTKTNENEFVLLFSNNTGVKYTIDKFDYKTAKQSIKNDKLLTEKGIKYTYFKYTATSELIWIEYQDGNYEECSFFNYNKAIRSGKGKKTKKFYLLD